MRSINRVGFWLANGTLVVAVALLLLVLGGVTIPSQVFMANILVAAFSIFLASV